MSWYVDDTTETRVVVKDGKRAIAYLAIGQDLHARLITAAPEGLALAEAIERLESSPMQRDHVPPAIRDMARALIRKVRA